jgi:hypothetical protein
MAMSSVTASLQQLRILLKLVELLFAPFFALAAQGKFCSPTRAAEMALARLEREWCDTMRRELVKMGYAKAADAPDSYFLNKLYRNIPNTDDHANATIPGAGRGPFSHCDEDVDAALMSWRTIVRLARLARGETDASRYVSRRMPISSALRIARELDLYPLNPNIRVRAPP